MNKAQKALAIFTVAVSAAAFIFAMAGSEVLEALRDLLRVFGIGDDAGAITYPLGIAIYAIYVFGMTLGVAALRWPVVSGGALLPLGACAFLLGGPVAKVYGISILVAGVLLLIISVRRRVD